MHVEQTNYTPEPQTAGHVETQTMQTAAADRADRADCTCRLSVIFFHLYLNFLVKFLL